MTIKLSRENFCLNIGADEKERKHKNNEVIDLHKTRLLTRPFTFDESVPCVLVFKNTYLPTCLRVNSFVTSARVKSKRLFLFLL